MSKLSSCWQHLSLSNTLAINATNKFPLQADNPGSEFDKEISLSIYLFIYSTHGTHNQNEFYLRKSLKEN
jgi:hypothetical protein